MELPDPKSGQLVVVDVARPVQGEPAEAHALRVKLRGALEQGYKYILLNVADLTYVDSVWLGAIVQGYVSAIRYGGTLKLLGASRKLRELLRVTKLDGVIEVFETEAAARASFDARKSPPR